MCVLKEWDFGSSPLNCHTSLETAPFRDLLSAMNAPNRLTMEGREGAVPQRLTPPPARDEGLPRGREGNADREKFEQQPAGASHTGTQ